MKEIYHLLSKWLEENKIEVIDRQSGLSEGVPLITINHKWYVDGVIHSTRCKLLVTGKHYIKIANDFPGSTADAIHRCGVRTFDLANPIDWNEFCRSFGVEV